MFVAKTARTQEHKNSVRATLGASMGMDNGGHRVAPHTKRQLYPRNIHFFVMEKYIEEAKQGQKVALDLVESIMRPPGLVKEELRRILVKISQFRPKITKSRACTFQMSRKTMDCRQRPTQQAGLVSSNLFLPNSHLIATPQASWRRQAPFTIFLAQGVKQ